MPALLAVPADLDPPCGTVLGMAHAVRAAAGGGSVLVQRMLAGWHVLVTLDEDGVVNVMSRGNGRECKNKLLLRNIAQALLVGTFSAGCVLDCVLVAHFKLNHKLAPAESASTVFADSKGNALVYGQLHVFDMLVPGGAATPYSTRRKELRKLMQNVKLLIPDACIKLVRTGAVLTATKGDARVRAAGRACLKARADGLVLRAGNARFPRRDEREGHLDDRCAPSFGINVKPGDLVWAAPLTLMAIGTQPSTNGKRGRRFRLGARGGDDPEYAYTFVGKAEVDDDALYARLLAHEAAPLADGVRPWAAQVEQHVWFAVPFPVHVRADYRMKDDELRFGIASAANAAAAGGVLRIDEVQPALMAHARRAFFEG
jgi:hypothetical protein